MNKLERLVQATQEYALWTNRASLLEDEGKFDEAEEARRFAFKYHQVLTECLESTKK